MKDSTSPFGKFIRFLDERLEEILMVVGFIVFTVLINLQVINRYVLSFVEIANMTTWTEEVARYIFVWISYIGASYAFKKREQIRVDALIRVLPSSISKALDIANPLIMLFISYFFISGGWNMLSMQMETGQSSPALQIPMWIAYASVPVGFALMCFRIIQNLVIDLKSMTAKEIGLGVVLGAIMLAPVYAIGWESSVAVLALYFFVFIFTGMPVAFALGACSIATSIATDAIPLDFFAQTAFTGIDSFPIMAVPFFVAAGIIMGTGGLMKRLLAMADELVGFFPGGLALVTVVTCMFFAAISGSGPATVAAIGTMMIPAMIKQGYHAGFACALVAAAGSIGVIIPPSNPFVIYGVVAEQSISKLFTAGIVPGIMIGLFLCVVSFVISKKNGWRGSKESFSMKGLLAATWDAKLALLVPVIILGGIYGGIMTPTESAAVAAMYGLVVSVFIYKDLNGKALYDSLVQSGLTSAVVIFLIAMATAFGRLIALEHVAQTVAAFFLSISTSKIVILFLINILLLIVGCVMEALAAIVILTPILLPMVVQLGVDPILFGVIMVVNLAIGFITPPVGVNLFVASGISKVRLEEIIKSITPFLLAMLVALLLISYVPDISLFLVDWMFNK